MVLITNAAGARCSFAVVCSGVQFRAVFFELNQERSVGRCVSHLAEAGERSLLSDVASLPTTADGVSGSCMCDAVGSGLKSRNSREHGGHLEELQVHAGAVGSHICDTWHSR